MLYLEEEAKDNYCQLYDSEVPADNSYSRCKTIEEAANSQIVCSSCLPGNEELGDFCVPENCVENAGADKSLCTKCNDGYTLHEPSMQCVYVADRVDDELLYCQELTDESDVQDLDNANCRLCRESHGLYNEDAESPRYICGN